MTEVYKPSVLLHKLNDCCRELRQFTAFFLHDMYDGRPDEDTERYMQEIEAELDKVLVTAQFLHDEWQKKQARLETEA